MKPLLLDLAILLVVGLTCSVVAYFVATTRTTARHIRRARPLTRSFINVHRETAPKAEDYAGYLVLRFFQSTPLLPGGGIEPMNFTLMLAQLRTIATEVIGQVLDHQAANIEADNNRMRCKACGWKGGPGEILCAAIDEADPLAVVYFCPTCGSDDLVDQFTDSWTNTTAPNPRSSLRGDGSPHGDVDLLPHLLPPSGLRGFNVPAFYNDILGEQVNVVCLDCNWKGPAEEVHSIPCIPFTTYINFFLEPAHRCPACVGANLEYDFDDV